MRIKVLSILTCLLVVIIYNCISVSTGRCEEAGEENQEPETCEDNYYLVKDNGKNKKLRVCYQSNGSQNGDIFVYLEEGKKRRIVLSSQGRAAIFSQGKKLYPDISVPWHISAEENDYTDYVWNGNTYEHRDAKKSKNNSAKALSLFKTGKIDDAIKLWESAIQLEAGGLSTEDYNNLGYAYYVKAKSSKLPDLYEEAEKYLQIALEHQPKRWVAHLNMADVNVEQNDFIGAIKHYKKLLELKPDYKNATSIREKISNLILEPREIGVEVVSLSYPSGEKNITFTRKDEHNVIRRGFHIDGTKRFEEQITDGQENGLYNSWFKNGNPAVKGQRKMGIAVGNWEYFDYQGKLSDMTIFNNDGSIKERITK